MGARRSGAARWTGCLSTGALLKAVAVVVAADVKNIYKLCAGDDAGALLENQIWWLCVSAVDRLAQKCWCARWSWVVESMNE